jgi:hypothetical protein
MKRSSVFLLLLLLPFGLFAQAKTTARASKVTTHTATSKDMVRAANSFLASLTEEQRKKATYTFEDEERFNWHFIPRARLGLPMKEMTPAQRNQATALLQTGMSDQGFAKAKAIMELEIVLKALENQPPESDYRDPEKYFFTIFGQPSDKNPWGWRVEGHHLALNFTTLTGTVVSETPAFMGTNPAIVLEGPSKGKQVLKKEADLAFALLNSFNPEQLRKAVIADAAPNDIVTGNARKAMLDTPVGLLYTEMSSEQQKTLSLLLNEYLNNYRQDLARDLRAKVERGGMGQMRFAWAGGRQPVLGQAHYYRIHNPVILIEYDNSQNNANHVHTVIRDLTNDFGDDALREHYERQPHRK